MSETDQSEPEVDRARIERQLRNVRLKLVTARRELQTLVRQSGLRQDAKHMRVEVDRAERHVRQLEETEAELVKTLEPETESAEESEPASAQAETEGDSDGRS